MSGNEQIWLERVPHIEYYLGPNDDDPPMRGGILLRLGIVDVSPPKSTLVQVPERKFVAQSTWNSMFATARFFGLRMRLAELTINRKASRLAKELGAEIVAREYDDSRQMIGQPDPLRWGQEIDEPAFNPASIDY